MINVDIASITDLENINISNSGVLEGNYYSKQTMTNNIHDTNDARRIKSGRFQT